MEITRGEFLTKLIHLSNNSPNVKSILDHYGSFNNTPKNLQDAILKEIGVEIEVKTTYYARK